MYESFQAQAPSGSIDADIPRLAHSGVGLLRAVVEHGPEPLVLEARRLLEGGGAAFEHALSDYDRSRSDHDFFAKALFQPYRQWLSDAGAGSADARAAGDAIRCPQCGGAPQLSVFDAANSSTSDGGARRLVCASCLTAWTFRRVACPACLEDDERKLGYYHSSALDHVRVDACDSCGRYIKTIDLGRLGHAVPLVDEVAGAPLDLWARDHGYEKIELNLIGL